MTTADDIAPPAPTLSAAKLKDLLAASPLIGWHFYCAYLQALAFLAFLHRDWNGTLDMFDVLGQLGRLMSFGFGTTLLVFLVLRHPPIRKSQGLVPRIMALLGTYIGIVILLIPTNPVHSVWLAISLTLTMAGTGFAFFSIFWLRRSFSLMPESRALVTTGPYAYVRHPLYVGEEIAVLGTALQMASPLATVGFLFQFAFQLVRMGYEEDVLSASFPEYAAYRSRVARLIPGIY